MKFVRDLEACRPGQIRQLFVREDGQHIEVSTVPNLALPDFGPKTRSSWA